VEAKSDEARVDDVVEDARPDDDWASSSTVVDMVNSSDSDSTESVPRGKPLLTTVLCKTTEGFIICFDCPSVRLSGSPHFRLLRHNLSRLRRIFMKFWHDLY
jgi:hypothetical protein